MGFSLEVSIPALTVFVQGILSFFSPCVLPLLPLYLGYLSGGAKEQREDGSVVYQKGKVMLHTVCFVLGISVTFFALGLGVSALGSFLNENQALFARIGGVIVIFFGLYQLGLFGKFRLLGREHRLPWLMGNLDMSPVTALIMGVAFSFAWTPCVGPALTSVLLMTASARTWGYGMLLIGVYTLGFVLPFLAVGLFTTALLDFFKKHSAVVRYTVRAGAILMVVMGVLMVTGTMNGITGYLSGTQTTRTEEDGAGGAGEESGSAEDTGNSEDAGSENTRSENNGSENTSTSALDFALSDQYGNTHTLDQYKGKIIFLNFWATWCGPCRSEMPDIQELYEAYGQEEVVILGVAAPELGQEGTEEEIAAFLEENGYTYPVLMDRDWELFDGYRISAFPTTFMIDAEGKVYGYVSGQLSRDMMESIIQQTKEGAEP